MTGSPPRRNRPTARLTRRRESTGDARFTASSDGVHPRSMQGPKGSTISGRRLDAHRNLRSARRGLRAGPATRLASASGCSCASRRFHRYAGNQPWKRSSMPARAHLDRRDRLPTLEQVPDGGGRRVGSRPPGDDLYSVTVNDFARDHATLSSGERSDHVTNAAEGRVPHTTSFPGRPAVGPGRARASSIVQPDMMAGGQGGQNSRRSTHGRPGPVRGSSVEALQHCGATHGSRHVSIRGRTQTLLREVRHAIPAPIDMARRGSRAVAGRTVRGGTGDPADDRSRITIHTQAV